MLKEIFLAVIQAATEFLPISSSGHLALISNLISKPSLYFFTLLHLSSLIAVIIFTRKEIISLITFDSNYRKIWIYLIIATAPALLVGFIFVDIVEKTFSSYLFIGLAFIFTSFILFLTKFSRVYSDLNIKNALIIGLFQVLALFPGISRSGMAISSALFLGVDKEKAVRFSFLLFIPLSTGAFIFGVQKGFYIDLSLATSFIVCLILSLVFLNLLLFIVRKRKFWMFSIYCFMMGLVSLFLLASGR